jgi:amino acid adenylation domain-containing protein
METTSAPALLGPGFDFRSTTLHERWREVVAAHPDGPALFDRDRILTFAEVDRLAAEVAERVANAVPAGPEAPVVLLADHDAAAVVSLLGILRSGRLLVPLDTQLPVARLRTIVEAMGATAAVVGTGHAALAEELGLRALSPAPSEIPAPRAVPDPDPLPDGVLAVLFTSGSTGRPKGVRYRDAQLLKDAAGSARGFAVTPADVFVQVLPLSFAAGFLALFSALLNGAAVVCHDPRTDGVRSLPQTLARARVSVLLSTPHLLRSLLAELPAGRKLSGLRIVGTAGEPIYHDDCVSAFEHLGERGRLFNWTGSSECGALSMHEVQRTDEALVVPAGTLLDGMEIRIVRSDGSAAEPGELGEMQVRSRHLSGGYWHAEEQTAERFGLDPDGVPVYRSGDLARSIDGILTLHGRADAGVKIRGYLVDPSEIEAALRSAPGVRECVALALPTPTGQTRLVAYVAQDPDRRTSSTAALRLHLRTLLPSYMVPASIELVGALPRNERGKVDRALLPPPVTERIVTTPPTTQWELALADIWCEVLGLEELDVDEDFTDLGGDSLAAQAMAAEVTARTGTVVRPSDLVSAPTIRTFTALVEERRPALPSHPDLFVLADRGSATTPVFCFAGGGALALTFRPLARHLADRSVYAFQSHGLERRSVPDWSVEAAAARALELLRIVQPTGPYVLVGHSFGGLVALEVAAALTEAGESVGLLGLLDTYLPGQNPSGFAPTPARKRSEWGRRRAVVEGLLPEAVPAPAEWPRHVRARLAGVLPFGSRNFEAFFDQAKLVGKRYAPARFAGRSLLVLADGNEAGAGDWRPHLAGACRVAALDCEHSSLLREPHARSLADLVATELMEAGL